LRTTGTPLGVRNTAASMNGDGVASCAITRRFGRSRSRLPRFEKSTRRSARTPRSVPPFVISPPDSSASASSCDVSMSRIDVACCAPTRLSACVEVGSPNRVTMSAPSRV
jgi:hypothetical protein